MKYKHLYIVYFSRVNGLTISVNHFLLLVAIIMLQPHRVQLPYIIYS